MYGIQGKTRGVSVKRAWWLILFSVVFLMLAGVGQKIAWASEVEK